MKTTNVADRDFKPVRFDGIGLWQTFQTLWLKNPIPEMRKASGYFQKPSAGRIFPTQLDPNISRTHLPFKP